MFPPSARSPVPDAGAQKTARKLVDDIYGKDIGKARTKEERASLARKVLQAGIDEPRDRAARYVLLSLAMDLAVDGGEVETVLAAEDELARSFEMDALKGKADVLARLERVKVADAAALAEQCTRLVDESVAADRYDIARQVAELAAVLARKIGDRGMVQAALARQQDVIATQTAHEQNRKALAALAANPNDTSAHLAVGRFLCFFRRDWEKGLPMLASSGDKALKALAEKEMGQPAEPANQVELADGWWDLAQKEQGVSQRNMLEHAAQWYKKAIPSLAGVLKLKAEARLAAVQENLDATASNGRVHVANFTSPQALQAFWCKDPRAWRVINGELVGEGRGEQHRPALTYNRYFSEISQVTIRGRIISSGNTNFRFCVGGINAILNWERAAKNLYWNGQEETDQDGYALSPGEWHTIVIEQKGPIAAISVDGKEIYKATARLAGTVTVYPMQSTIGIASIKIAGNVDPNRRVQGPSHGEVH